MEAECQALLERRHARSGIAGRVRELLVAGIVRDAEPPDSDAVAAALHLSRRTLQRRLNLEGTSFRALLEEVREHLAVELLGAGALSVSDVAQRLGYVEMSSFSQAFRRWKGMGPRAYAAAGRRGAQVESGLVAAEGQAATQSDHHAAPGRANRGETTRRAREP
jgi:AraC-like DNA-binding protein